MQLLFLVSLVSATSYALPHESHSHHVERRLPDATWFHERDHPVHQLFRRAKINDITFADVGTDEWKAGFPTDVPDASAIPEAWSRLLDAAVKDGKIPDIPVTTQIDGGDITYPDGSDPNSQEICSSTYQCRTPDSIWDGPAGYFGISFDDGPLPSSDPLLKFLKSKGEKATHFMIGQNILQNPTQFKQTFDQGHDIAVHTWTHRAMTTLSNSDVVSELGWTMQLIHNSTQGLVPKFWRPPYGDSDTRVQAIAREVFGLKTIIWNKDTNDWGIAEGSQKKTTVTSAMSKFLKSPKSTGLVVLEHESSPEAVDIFIKAYPSIKKNGWKTKSLVQLIGDKNPYQNVDGNAAKHDDRFLANHDAPPASKEDPQDKPQDDGNEDDSSTPDDEGDAGEGDDTSTPDDEGDDDDASDSGVMPTTTRSADKPEVTDDSVNFLSSDDSSSSDDSETSDDDSSSSDDDSVLTDDDSVSTNDDTSTDDSDSSDSEDPTGTSSDDSSVPSPGPKKGSKDNGALPQIAGLMSGSLLILLCLAPGVVLILG